MIVLSLNPFSADDLMPKFRILISLSDLHFENASETMQVTRDVHLNLPFCFKERLKGQFVSQGHADHCFLGLPSVSIGYSS